MLQKLGFKSKFVNWVKQCITTPSFEVLVNGQPSKRFSSTRGLRQGDPMSPLPFVIAMEGLTSLLDYAQAAIKITGFDSKSCKVNYIFFADDVIIFSKASISNVRKIEEVLYNFSKFSGLSPSLIKTKIIFGRSVDSSINSALL